MKFALAQINTTVGDLEGNAEKIRRAGRSPRTRRATCCFANPSSGGKRTCWNASPANSTAR